MTALNLVPVFLIGLLGSIHCVGMCGGIVAALSTSSPRPFPLAVVALSNAPPAAVDALARVLAYNGGRIASYALAGAIAGGLVGGARTLAGIAVLQQGGYLLANLMLVALGLYLMNAWSGVARLEVLGKHLWRHVQPLTRRILPLDTPWKMLAAGALWGWLPCGLVYSMLFTAMLTGSTLGGASVMLAFGLGTLPMLLSLGLVGDRARLALQRPAVRRWCGVVVLGFGVLGMARFVYGVPLGWLDALCIVPAGAHS